MEAGPDHEAALCLESEGRLKENDQKQKRKLEEPGPDYEALFLESERRLKEKERQLEENERQLKENERQLKEKDQVIEQKNQIIEQKNQEMSKYRSLEYMSQTRAQIYQKFM